MMDNEKNEVEEFVDYIFDYVRIAQTPIPNISAKGMERLGESFAEGLRAGLEETEKQ